RVVAASPAGRHGRPGQSRCSGRAAPHRRPGTVPLHGPDRHHARRHPGRRGAWLDTLPLLAPNGVPIAIGLVVLCITYLSLIVGELVPKRIAMNDPER